MSITAELGFEPHWDQDDFCPDRISNKRADEDEDRMDELTPEELAAIRKAVPMFGDNISIDVMTGKRLNPPGVETEPAPPDEIRRGDESGDYFVDGIPDDPIALYRVADRIHEMSRVRDWTDVFQGLPPEDQPMAIYNWNYENDRASVTVARAREIAQDWGYQL